MALLMEHVEKFTSMKLELLLQPSPRHSEILMEEALSLGAGIKAKSCARYDVKKQKFHEILL
jgi:hypothetical protein